MTPNCYSPAGSFCVTELQCWELACVGVSHVDNNAKVLMWHSEQPSNWQRFSFLMILSFQIFILWVFCRLQRIAHIHSSCICCAMGAFSLFLFFFFCSSFCTQRPTKRKRMTAKWRGCEQQCFRLRSPHVSRASQIRFLLAGDAIPPLPNWQCLEIKYSLYMKG